MYKSWAYLVDNRLASSVSLYEGTESSNKQHHSARNSAKPLCRRTSGGKLQTVVVAQQRAVARDDGATSTRLPSKWKTAGEGDFRVDTMHSINSFSGKAQHIQSFLQLGDGLTL